jgi:hypothetical protein
VTKAGGNAGFFVGMGLSPNAAIVPAHGISSADENALLIQNASRALDGAADLSGYGPACRASVASAQPSQ